MGMQVMARLRAARDFLADVRAEMRKSSWPTRHELVESTVVLVVSVILFSVFVGLSDVILARLIGVVVQIGK